MSAADGLVTKNAKCLSETLSAYFRGFSETFDAVTEEETQPAASHYAYANGLRL
jgi:hypothetical protein